MIPFKQLKTHLFVAVLGLMLLSMVSEEGRAQEPDPQPCGDRLGWFPSSFGLKDHTAFTYEDHYYIASIFVSEQNVEDRFAYARSLDLCEWEHLDPVLTERRPGAWDEYRIWAPFVYQENGVYYMFYTGVTQYMAQSIMLATSTDPADASSWQEHGVVFQPDHPGMAWHGFGQWSDCRDPTVIRAGNTYYLVYTGYDVDGGIVGLATASTPYGPWRDWGSILTVPGVMLESPLLVAQGGYYYLCYNEIGPDGRGEQCTTGPTPAGPWSTALPLYPGRVHEIWQDRSDKWYVSYLSQPSVHISPLIWDAAFDPPRPFIGAQVRHVWLPLLQRER